MTQANQRLLALDEVARRRVNTRERETAVQGTILAVRGSIDNFIAEKANPIALDVLQELVYESAEQLRNLDATLTRLERQSKTGASWAAAVKRPLTLGLNHPLAILALSDKVKRKTIKPK